MGPFNRKHQIFAAKDGRLGFRFFPQAWRGSVGHKYRRSRIRSRSVPALVVLVAPWGAVDVSEYPLMYLSTRIHRSTLYLVSDRSTQKPSGCDQHEYVCVQCVMQLLRAASNAEQNECM